MIVKELPIKNDILIIRMNIKDKDKEAWRREEREEGDSRKRKGGTKIRTRTTSYMFYSSAGASCSSLASEGLSAESCISEVHNVKLSRSSCIIKVESL